MRLTPAGAITVQHAGRILASVDALRQDLAGLADRLAGRVRLGTYPAAMAVLAPRAVALLRSEHPGLEASLSEAPTPTLLRQLRAGLVAAGLGICLVPEVAVPSVPAGVTTIGVEDPGWLGRTTFVVTSPEPGPETATIVDALRRAGEGIHEDVQHRRPSIPERAPVGG